MNKRFLNIVKQTVRNEYLAYTVFIQGQKGKKNSASPYSMRLNTFDGPCWCYILQKNHWRSVYSLLNF